MSEKSNSKVRNSNDKVESSKSSGLQVLDNSKKTSSVDVTVVNGSSAVVVEQLNPNASEPHNDDSWSKVENKGRGNRARALQKQTPENSNNYSGGQGKAGKVKSGRTSASRKRTAHRKIVKEIMTTIFERVDNEISRRRKLEMRAFHEERKRKEEERIAAASNTTHRPSSLRDVVVGKLQSHSLESNLNMKKQLGTNTVTAPTASNTEKVNDNAEKNTEMHCPKLQKAARLHQKLHNADQNTAPTLPETLSGVSAMSNSNNSAGSMEYQQQETTSNDSSDEQQDKSQSLSPPHTF